jgi:hypothetical protein
MRRSLAGAFLLGAVLSSTPPPAQADVPKPAEPRAVAAKIDQLIEAGWKAKKAVPAPLSDDAEFVRRAYLDLTGRVPDILQARDFLDKRDKDKRAKLIDDLLDNPPGHGGGSRPHNGRYPVHFANIWTNLLLPEAESPLVAPYRPGMGMWLRTEFKNNTSYDKMVRTILESYANGGRGGATPFGFYQANSFLPENLAAATSRLFLGVKIECAQCHNHPMARWTRKQFWEQAAFFATANPRLRGRPGVGPAVGAREIKIPNTNKTAKARFLDGKEPAFSDAIDSRVTLAEWITKPENPYFARAAANRMWELLLGTGLVDPVDEASPDNLPSHPEVLNELASQFVAHKFDLKFLIRTIMLTRAYQATSRMTHPSQADARLFARMKVRGLTPEQLYDSLALVTGNEDEEEVLNPFGFRPPNARSQARAEFLRRFPNQDKRTEQQTSILQALHLMNGKLVTDATSLEHNQNLKIIAENRTGSTSRRVEQIYLITLNRKPRPAERARLVAYVDKGGPSGDSAKALCDVFWALLNSSEFCVNH